MASQGTIGQEFAARQARATAGLLKGLSGMRNHPVGAGLADVLFNAAGVLGTGSPNPAGRELTKSLHEFAYGPPPKISRFDNQNLTVSFRDPSGINRKEGVELAKSAILSKAVLDVGTLTNFADVVGGQAMGFVSLDTRMARATARPRSMTLYQTLAKTPAYQIVDFWSYIGDTGGALPGSAYTGFTTVSTGALNFNAGDYRINYIDLKLAVDGRGVTTALAAQNSFVNIADAETANAAISVLESMDWALYWGNATLYNNIPQGIYHQVKADPEGAQNLINYYGYWQTASSTGVTEQQALFNLIYDTFSKAVGYRIYGRPTHAFMSPELYGGLQSLVTSQLNNLVNVSSNFQDAPLVINADYRGVRTGFGNLAFEIDLFLTARLRAAQGIIRNGQASSGTFVSLPASVTLSASAAPAGTVTYFDSTYAGSYSYAVAATDASRNETNLVWAATDVTVASGDIVTVTITPPSDGSAVSFIVYRSGKGYSYSSTDTTAPYQVRFVGEVAANGTTAVTFTDTNSNIPGSQTVFLLDLDSEDDALDYRYLLPLSRVNLFQNNLFMPWAVVHIGAPRVRIPKFHAIIENVVIPTLGFNPLSAQNPSPLG